MAKNPHAVLAEAWLDCRGDQPAVRRMRAVGRFIGKHRGHEEAAILRARIAGGAALSPGGQFAGPVY